MKISLVTLASGCHTESSTTVLFTFCPGQSLGTTGMPEQSLAVRFRSWYFFLYRRKLTQLNTLRANNSACNKGIGTRTEVTARTFNTTASSLPLVTFMAKRNTVRADHQISPETKHQRRGSGVSAKLRVRVISHRLDFRMMMASVVESCSVQTWKKHEKVLHEGKSTRVEGTGHNTPLVHALFS